MYRSNPGRILRAGLIFEVHLYGAFQSQVTFLGHKWENRFFAEAGRKKVCSFILKEKMYLSDQGTDYLEIHWFPYISQILSPKIAAQSWPIFIACIFNSS